MLSSDPCICLVHPSKRPVGVCHLCLRDRLVRLSLSGESSSSQTLAPSSSSRSSIDSSSWPKQDESSNSKGVGKVGTIFSLIESDSEDAVAAAATASASAAEPSSMPSWLPRSKSLSQWSSSSQPPRRSSSTKEGFFARFPDARNGQMPLHRASAAAAVAEQDLEIDGQHTVSLSKSKSGKQNGFPQSPLVHEKTSASATPVVQHLDRDHKQHRSSSGFSWISSLFGLRKRKKKSVQAEPTETNFFPPEGWNDVVPREAVPERDRLWRSRSVSSGRTIKKCSVGDLKPDMAAEAVASSSPAHRLHQVEPGTVSSLIALDLRERPSVVATSSPAATVARKMLPRSCHNKVDNVLYDVDEAEPACGSVATLMDIDRKWACGSPVLQRSSSTGKWRRRLMGESPSSVAMANPMPGGSEWSFYLTPLRTFRSRSSRHAR